MTAAHLDSDQYAIREADKRRTLNVRAYAERAIAAFFARPSYDNCETAKAAIQAVFLDHVRVLEERAASPSVERWEWGQGREIFRDGPIKPPIGITADGKPHALPQRVPLPPGEHWSGCTINPAPITAAPNGERKPLVPRHLGDKCR